DVFSSNDALRAIISEDHPRRHYKEAADNALLKKDSRQDAAACHCSPLYLDAYKYGYDVNPHGQFHHETRGPHGITYGCYGYVDPFGKLKATFYISDGWGYRVVQPGRDVELFLHKHEHHANGDKHDHHEHHGSDGPSSAPER
ncbi:Collagen alpha-2(IV) chain, partial [Temnothorax longispinosus]